MDVHMPNSLLLITIFWLGNHKKNIFPAFSACSNKYRVVKGVIITKNLNSGSLWNICSHIVSHMTEEGHSLTSAPYKIPHNTHSSFSPYLHLQIYITVAQIYQTLLQTNHRYYQSLKLTFKVYKYVFFTRIVITTTV